MIVVKGTGGGFKLEGGKRVHVPASHGMMHDPTGTKYRACTVLWGPFERANDPVDESKIPRAARQYFGRTHKVKRGSTVLPPRALSAWSKVGDVGELVATVYYRRRGTKAPGKWYHPFGKRRLSFFFRKGHAVLYAWHAWYRLELPKGCILDDRGFVYP